MLAVTTDRQSAFDRHLASIPFKGAVLNQTSAWWFPADRGHRPQRLAQQPRPQRASCAAARCSPSSSSSAGT